MVKAIYEAVTMAIPRREVVYAAKNFLMHSNEDVVHIDNVHSPKFGSSDFSFINKAKTNLTVARLNYKEDREKFLISSISYYFWLKEFITVSEFFFKDDCGLGMYLFSDDFSPAICHVIDNLTNKLRVHLVKYNILQVEDLDEPAIYFQQVTPENLAQDMPRKEVKQKEAPPTTEISSEELSEFNRLKECYLT
ncbi:MAG: hypothetical protein HWN69_01640 [Desulfobacterales bacterium]|nr:hypothetical protein [Desulfobacterales bacterium]